MSRIRLVFFRKSVSCSLYGYFESSASLSLGLELFPFAILPWEYSCHKQTNTRLPANSTCQSFQVSEHMAWIFSFAPGLPRAPSWWGDLDSCGSVTTHYPACQEPSTTSVGPEELRMCLGNPRSPTAGASCTLQLQQRTVPEYLGENHIFYSPICIPLTTILQPGRLRTSWKQNPASQLSAGANKSSFCFKLPMNYNFLNFLEHLWCYLGILRAAIRICKLKIVHSNTVVTVLDLVWAMDLLRSLLVVYV